MVPPAELAAQIDSDRPSEYFQLGGGLFYAWTADGSHLSEVMSNE
jgi:hypothetical protein